MRSNLRPMLLISALVLVTFAFACGGDDDSGGTPLGPGRANNGTSNTGGDGSNGGRSNAARPAKIEDAVYTKGTVHIEVTGDKKATFDKDGAGYAGGGLLLLSYADQDVSASLSFAAEGAGDAPGAASITTKEFATASEWGKDCTFKLDQSKASASGEFECRDVEAIELKSTKPLKVTVKGKFSAKE
jgi:hypothetical protein